MGCFSPSESQNKTRTKSQEGLLKELIKKFSPEIDKGPDIFPGDKLAGLSGLQQTGISAASDIGDAFTTPTKTAGIGESPLFGDISKSTASLLDPISKTTAGSTGGVGKVGLSAGPSNIQAGVATPGAEQLTPEQFDKFFRGSVSDPARKTFREETAPAISEAFAGPGFFGTARSKEIVKQKTDLEDSLRSESIRGQFSNLERNQQLQEAAATRDLARDQLDQSRQQFNQQFDRQTNQFAQSLNMTADQFNANIDKSRDEFTRTLGLSVDNLNFARENLGFNQALQLSDSQANTLTTNIAVAASQVQGLKELIGIGSVEQSQEQAEIFAEIEEFALENQLVDPADLSILFALLGQNFGSEQRSGTGLGFVAATSAVSSIFE